MRLFLTMFLLLFTSTMSFAATYVKGTVYKGTQTEALDIPTFYHKGTKEPFPRKYYDLSGLFIQSLEYDNSQPKNDRKYDIKQTQHIFPLDEYATMSSLGKLELVYYNPDTKQYKFKLTFEPSSLQYYSKPGNINLIGKIKINGQDHIYLTGTYDPNQNKIYSMKDQIISLQIIDPKKRGEETLLLTIRKNIPVQVELN